MCITKRKTKEFKEFNCKACGELDRIRTDISPCDHCDGTMCFGCCVKERKVKRDEDSEKG